MTDDKKTTLTRQVDRGQAAQTVLNELEQAFDALEQDCFDTFRKSEIHDNDGRLSCRLYLRVMDDVKGRFTLAVRKGEAARKELIRINTSKVRKING
jgi:hypothetical protein